MYKIAIVFLCTTVCGFALPPKHLNIVELGLLMKQEFGINMAVCVDGAYLNWKNSGTEDTIILCDGGERINVDLSDINTNSIQTFLTSQFKNERYQLVASQYGSVITGEFKIKNSLLEELSYTNGYDGTAFELIKTIHCDKVYFHGFDHNVHQVLQSKTVKLSPQVITLQDLLLVSLEDKRLYWYVVNNNIHIISSETRSIQVQNGDVDPRADISEIFVW